MTTTFLAFFVFSNVWETVGPVQRAREEELAGKMSAMRLVVISTRTTTYIAL